MKRRAFALTGLISGFVLAMAAPALAQPAAATAPKVTLETTMGAITITLDPVGAPKTAAHMLRMFKTGHYEGAAFFRVEPGYLIQIGDLDAKLNYRRPYGKPVALETATNRHKKYAVALAHGEDPNDGHSSFYIDLAPNANLNADPNAPPNTTGYAVFGEVTEGRDVVDRIGKVELAPEGGPFPGKLPKTPIVVTKVTISE